MQKELIFKKCSLLILITTLIVSTFSQSLVLQAKKSSKAADFKAGDNIVIGKLDNVPLNWTILNFDANTRQALVVTRNPIYTVSVRNYKADIGYNFKNKSAGYVPWASNLWRFWLNETFYAAAFNEAEKNMIVPTQITKSSHQSSIMNFYHDTKLDSYYLANDKTKNSLNTAIYNNQSDTTDKIFFLSSDEYTAYQDKICVEVRGEWPLRTNAYDDPVKTLYVNDTKKQIDRLYTYDGACDGIRPAMTINLGAAPEATTDSKKQSTTSSATDTKSADSTTSDKKAATDTIETDKNTSTDKAKDTSSNKPTVASAKSTSKSSSTTLSKNKNTRRFRRNYSNNAKDTATVTNTSNAISLPNDSNYSMKKNSNAVVAIDLGYLNSTSKNYTVTYKSSNADIFTVDSSGNITAGSESGSATLSVRMKKSNGKIYNMTCRIDVS